MPGSLSRRDFVQLSIGGGALYLGGGLGGGTRAAAGSATVAGRATGARIARLYLGTPDGHWPTPQARYPRGDAPLCRGVHEVRQGVCRRRLSPDMLVTSVDDVRKLRSVLAEADGILAIHLSIGIRPVLAEILAGGKPTMFFAIPYSGHEWADLGDLTQARRGQADCMLTSDLSSLPPPCARCGPLHYLKAAKILNLSTARVGRLRGGDQSEVRHHHRAESTRAGPRPLPRRR